MNVYPNTLEQFTSGMSLLLQNTPSYLFIKDLDSRYVNLSQSMEHDWGINKKYLIGYSDYDAPWNAFAEQYQHHDHMSRKTGYHDVFEPVPLNKNLVVTVRSVKFPIRDNTGTIVGVMGQTQILSSHSNLNESLNALMNVDKINFDFSMKSQPSYQVQSYPEKLHFTSRESECLFLLIRGKTAKEIGKFLQISPRTIETYIEKIKLKLNVSSRSQIISKAIELGLLDIIPKQEILYHLYKHPDKWKQFFS